MALDRAKSNRTKETWNYVSAVELHLQGLSQAFSKDSPCELEERTEPLQKFISEFSFDSFIVSFNFYSENPEKRRFLCFPWWALNEKEVK